ncbi:MAG: hypothetical protein C0399_03230 [Syntrophus sp. (in: bacteria)]|nr:hypothetical protein [Syntrophus sp. (in: bacteria)]
MKKIGSVLLGVLIVLALLSGVALADCESDCNGPFQTCLNICRQTTKVDSAEGTKCVNNCLNGVSGCNKRCEAKNKKSDNTTDCTKGYLSATGDSVAGENNIVLASNCIEKGLTCVLNGTPCCSPYECKGKFPNTYCK